LHIRPARSADAELILAFISELADYERLAHEVVATPGQLQSTLFGKNPVAEVVIAEWQDRPAGFALFFASYSTFLALPGIYLEDLFVRPEYRGKGIGKALLVYLAGLVHERGWGRLDWSVLDWNDPAIDFYRAIGAQAMDDWTQFRLDGQQLSALARSGTPTTLAGSRVE
jgi:GNAT superfamily N-acetyltransferase